MIFVFVNHAEHPQPKNILRWNNEPSICILEINSGRNGPCANSQSDNLLLLKNLLENLGCRLLLFWVFFLFHQQFYCTGFSKIFSCSECVGMFYSPRSSHHLHSLPVAPQFPHKGDPDSPPWYLCPIMDGHATGQSHSAGAALMEVLSYTHALARKWPVLSEF